MPSAKKIRVFAGPNGSGKSTLFPTIADKKRWGGYYDGSRGLRYLPPELYLNIQD